MNSLEKIRNVLRDGGQEIEVEETVRLQAVKSLSRMLRSLSSCDQLTGRANHVCQFNH